MDAPPPTSIDAAIDAVVRPLADLLSAIVFVEVPLFGVGWPVVVVWLVLGAVLCTLIFRGVNLWGLPTALAVLRGRYDDADAPGQVSHFQALATALSGTVGIGNIGGVAIAITMGGPGVAFWMVLAGVLGMATKFAECTLGVRYRTVHPDGTVSGGPMHYLYRGLAERGWPRLGRWLGAAYAGGIVVGCLGIGNMFQSNQAAAQLIALAGGRREGWLAGSGWLIGLVLAGIVGLVILGGISSIAKVTSRLVPLMAGLYVASAGLVVALNVQVLPQAVVRIVTEAFTAPGIVGGAAAVMVLGFQRAVFSNEAGIGSASIAHAAVRTRHPATEGLVALFEPLVDTVVVCTLTALVIVTTAERDPSFLEFDAEGIALTSEAFGRSIPGAPYLIGVAALLFAVSTMISWAYYGQKGWTYLVGRSRGAREGYKVVFCVFVALGAAIELGAVLDISDALVFLLCIPNLIGVLWLTPVVWEEVRRLRARGPNPGGGPPSRGAGSRTSSG